jgi:acetyltransferase-like isoleucine patch superfamily enzyme
MSWINRDLLSHKVDSAVNFVRTKRDTWLSCASASWRGVELGSGCDFYGKVMFRRHPGSQIRIATGCRFRSAPWANVVGLNHGCIICTLENRARIEIGVGCGFSGVVITAVDSIVLGNRVLCGANVTIMDTDWHPVDPIARAQSLPPGTAPVLIEDDVWLGLNVTVLKGCHIGPGTVVAAGSVVTRSLPEHVLAAGVPAQVIRTIQP